LEKYTKCYYTKSKEDLKDKNSCNTAIIKACKELYESIGAL